MTTTPPDLDVLDPLGLQRSVEHRHHVLTDHTGTRETLRPAGGIQFSYGFHLEGNPVLS